jgi:hypothetical protein
MRAAIAALPHEVPRLMVSAQVNEQSFAELLDGRLARMAEAKLIEAQPNNGGDKADARLRPPIPDRRFRRI